MASTITRIFDKHPLRGERDILFIGEILDAKLHDYMEVSDITSIQCMSDKIESSLSTTGVFHFQGAGQNLPSDVQEKLSIVMVCKKISF